MLCVADWVLIEDFGFFGGLGTDPNSMIPMALLAVAGYRAVTAASPATAPAADPVPVGPPGPANPAEVLAGGPDGHWRDRLRPATLHRWLTAATFGTMTSLAAVGVIVLGAVPMAAAQATPAASTILAEAVDGSATPINAPAPGFTLTDQHGQTVSLSGLRGKVILLTFLDPVCVTDCPLIAQEFRQAGQMLGAASRRVDLVAVNLNPLYSQISYTQAFDQQERLAGVPDWLYLTSSPARLRQVYAGYGVASQTLPGGAMLGHSDIAFVIDASGRLREELDMDPGPGTAATKSSFAAELADAASQVLHAS